MHQSFATQLFNAVSWTLIHSLWQGLLLAVIAGIILSSTKRSSPTFRYSLLITLLFCFTGTALITLVWQWQLNPVAAKIALADSATVAAHELSAQTNWWNVFTRFINHYQVWLVSVWVSIVLFKLVRMLVDFYYVNRLCTYGINKPEESWIIRLQQLARKTGIRKQVVMLESRLVNIPLVAGHFKPIILLPLGMLNHLSVAEAEAVLLHELAHIRRHDYLINLVQRITSIIFFFNPGVLWLSALIRIERENCCDDMAIAHTNDKLKFVEALISIKQHSLSSPALTMNFLGQKNLLLHRVNRIVYSRNKSLNLGELLFVVFSVICTTLYFISPPTTAREGAKLSSAAGHSQSADYTANFVYQMPEQQVIKPVIPNRERNSLVVNNLKKKAPANKKAVENETKEKQNITLKTEAIIAHSDQQTAIANYREYERDLANAEHDRKQAEKDRIQAELDRKAAEKDRIQAELDRKQADLDRKQAERDRAQAELDRKQAEKDREQAFRDASPVTSSN